MPDRTGSWVTVVRAGARSIFAILLTLLMLSSPAATQVLPTSPLPAGAEVVAVGLTNPRGFTWGPDGTLFVALAGTGGTTMATEPAPITQALGPFFTGPTASLVKIMEGCPVPVVTGLPSASNTLAGTYGVADVAILDGQLYGLFVGGGEARSNPDFPSGIYRILEDGTTEIVADLSAWTRANPTETVPWDYDPETGGFDMVADGDRFWVSQPNRDEILTDTVDGTVTRVVDLSVGHPVLTGIDLAPQGGVYVGTLTPAPFLNGSANVLHVAEDGTVTEVWTGLTAVTGVAVGLDGTLYVAEMATGNLEQAPFFQPGTGKIVRQSGPDSAEEVASGLTFPLGLAFGPDGGLYVSAPAIGANSGEGMVIRLSVDSREGTPEPGEALSASACLGGGSAVPVASPVQ